MVRTPGFHPGNRGSIPLGATNCLSGIFNCRLSSIIGDILSVRFLISDSVGSSGKMSSQKPAKVAWSEVSSTNSSRCSTNFFPYLTIRLTSSSRILLGSDKFENEQQRCTIRKA